MSILDAIHVMNIVCNVMCGNAFLKVQLRSFDCSVYFVLDVEFFTEYTPAEKASLG